MVKFSVYLNRHVFVMLEKKYPTLCEYRLESDQPAHPRSIILVSIGRFVGRQGLNGRSGKTDHCAT